MPTDLRIAGLFEDALTTSITGDAITSVVVRLSGPPDEPWTEAFHHEWALTSYPRKRSARVGSLRSTETGVVRHGLILAASPADYVTHHRRHLEDAVLRANERVRERASKRDATVADAARAIREINRAHYDGPGDGLRLAV